MKIRKNPKLFEIRRKIKEYRKRLDTLKNQGFRFSKDIYEDINTLEEKISYKPLNNLSHSKKIKISLGIISVFLIIIIAIAIIPPPSPPPIKPGNSPGIVNNPLMEISIDNVYEGMQINKSFTIYGNTIHKIGTISYVKVEIDGSNDWIFANGTSIWTYFFNISNRSEGKHVLSFRCSDGKENLTIHRTIYIENISQIVKKITVEILTPNNEDLVSNLEYIAGSIQANNCNIQGVQIKFDEEDWSEIEIIKHKNFFYFDWNTRNMENGPHKISVRAYDDAENYSKIENISITIDNDEFDPGEVTGFQIFFFDVNNIKANQTYNISGIHRKENKPKYTKQFTILNYVNTHDWLNISFTDPILETPADGKTYYFSFNIKITDDAPMNTHIKLEMSCLTGAQGIFGSSPYKWNKLWERRSSILTNDIDIQTGEW